MTTTYTSYNQLPLSLNTNDIAAVLSISRALQIKVTALDVIHTDELMNNIQTASTTEMNEFTSNDFAMIEQVKKAINAKVKVGCTGCRYCMPCPKNVDIPGTFAAYNRLYTESKFWGWVEYTMCTALRKDSTAASNCIECGKCELHCPKAIKIREELKNARNALENPLYKIVRKAATILKF